MLYGLIANYDRYEWKIAISGSYSYTGGTDPGGDPGASLLGTLLSEYATSQFTVGTGIDMGIASHDGGSGPDQCEYRLNIPVLGVSEGKIIAGFATSAQCHLEIDDLQFLAHPDIPRWKIQWSEMRWYVEGALEATIAGGALENTQWVTPASIPLFGIPATISALAQVNYVPTLPPHPGGETRINATATCTATGGWRVKLAGEGSFREYPISIIIETPDVPPGYEPPVGMTTYTGEVSSAALHTSSESEYDVLCDNCPEGEEQGTPATVHVRENDFTWNLFESSLGLLPALPRDIRYLNSDQYAALWLRGPIPSTSHRTYYAQCTSPPGATDCSQHVTFAEQTPSYASLLATVIDTGHAIRDPLETIVPCPYSIVEKDLRGKHVEAVVTSPGTDCGPVDPEE